MSLKDRIKGKKLNGYSEDTGEYRISIRKVVNAVAKTKNPADLGNIVKEFAKFLSSMDTKDAQIVFKGNFDLGQRTLLNCVLSSFIDDGIYEEDEIEELEQVKAPSKLIRKRKSVKERMAEEIE